MNFGTSTRTTVISVLYFYRKRRIMKRSCATEMPTGTKALSGFFTILSEAAGSCPAVLDKSLSDTTQLQNILFLLCSLCKFCATAFLWFLFLKGGQAYTNQDPEDIYQWETERFFSGQITFMSETPWHLQRHYKSHIVWLKEVQTNKKPNQPKADMPLNILWRIKTTKKGRRLLTRWNSYTLCSADSRSYPKLPISKDRSCGKSISVFTPTGCTRRNLTHSFQTGKHSGFNMNLAVLKLALTAFPYSA